MKSASPLGLIAGKGGLPLAVCKTAKERSIPVIAIVFDKETENSLNGLGETHLVKIGKAGKTLKILKDANVEKVVLIGKFEKKIAFTDIAVDAAGAKILARAVAKRDSNIMNSIIEEIEARGFKVEKQTDWIPGLIPAKGILGKVKPSKKLTSDFEYGFPICRDLAGKDIGQTIIVKDGVVIAVEAVEGTDVAIVRGCELAGKGAAMIKAARPKQDSRFDIPSIGIETIKNLARYKAAGLAVEADKTIIVDMPEVIALCNRKGISLVAM